MVRRIELNPFLVLIVVGLGSLCALLFAKLSVREAQLLQAESQQEDLERKIEHLQGLNTSLSDSYIHKFILLRGDAAAERCEAKRRSLIGTTVTIDNACGKGICRFRIHDTDTLDVVERACGDPWQFPQIQACFSSGELFQSCLHEGQTACTGFAVCNKGMWQLGCDEIADRIMSPISTEGRCL